MPRPRDWDVHRVRNKLSRRMRALRLASSRAGAGERRCRDTSQEIAVNCGIIL